MLFAKDEFSSRAEQTTRVFPGGTSPHVTAGAKALKAALPEIRPDSAYHYVSRAKWSMHDLLQYLLSFTGPADVYFTTWNITMGPATLLMELKRAGLIRSLHAVVDSRVKVNAPEAHQILMMNADSLKLAKVHAKVMVIHNEFHSAVVVSSQNFTNTKRIEAGVIDTREQTALSHLEWLKPLFTEGNGTI